MFRADWYTLDCATNNIGVRFATTPYSMDEPAPVDNINDIYSEEIITDQINWTQISGEFMADSAYSHLLIGNFFDDEHTDTANCASLGYYYIDNVQVLPLEIECFEGLNENEQQLIHLYPSPANEFIIVSFTQMINNIILYDLLGNIIERYEVGSSRYTLDLSRLPNGQYLLAIGSGSGEIVSRSFAVIH